MEFSDEKEESIFQNFEFFLNNFSKKFDFDNLIIIWIAIFIIWLILLLTNNIREEMNKQGETQKNHCEREYLKNRIFCIFVKVLHYHGLLVDITRGQNETDDQGQETIKYRIKMDHYKNLRKLHKACERCFIKKNESTCIKIATYYPHLMNIRWGIFGMTPFQLVCQNRNKFLISFMLERGGDPWMRTKDDEDALCLTLRSYIENPHDSDFSCLYILKEYGCNVDVSNKWYKIHLESAVMMGNTSLALWIFNESSVSSFESPSASFPPRRHIQ